MNNDRKAQELSLWTSWHERKDKKARNELLKSLAPLLNKEINKYNASPLPRSAIETEARVLALKAFDSYDPNKAQLNTHVTNHLKHLQRYVLTYQNVGKIPEHRGIAIGRFQNIQENLAEDFNREPTVTELADALSWSPAEVERMQAELRKDLNLSTKDDDEGIGGFFDYSLKTNDTLKNALEFVYYDAGPQDKKILEYTFGLNGKQILPPAQIAFKANMPESAVKGRLKILAKEIKNARL